jgi:putative membrane protein
LRTALALLAAGVALAAFDLSFPRMVQTGAASLLLLLGMFAAVAGWVRWARAERAMRLGEPLPASPLSVVVSLGVVLTATVLLLVEMST